MGDETTNNIPLEIEAEILSYLPVKSLIRFTCVCKSWFDLIQKDHHFAMKQFLRRTTLSSKVFDHVDYLFDRQKSGKTCLYSLTEAKTFRLFKSFECIPAIRIWVSNTCHGIMCIAMASRSDILLCNPSIREVVLLPSCPIYNSARMLGFDPINNDYKVVAISFPNDHERLFLCKVNVYSVRHGCWRDVASHITISTVNYYSAWLFWKRLENEKHGRCLLTFDMVEEVLEELPLPTECNLHHEHKLVSTTKWQACLTCLNKSGNDLADVWVLKSDDCQGRVWNKEFAIKRPGDKPMKALNVWFNDNELLVLMNKIRRNRNDSKDVFCYDWSTQQLKRTGRSGHMYCMRKGYVESLVSIKLFMSTHDNNDQAEASNKQKEGTEYLFCEAGRDGIRWSSKFKLVEPSN